MADVFTVEHRAAVMRTIRSAHTKPELALRRALHNLGFRFRLHVRSLPGCPDIVLPKHTAVIQVRGCFWHGHTCTDGHFPKSRQEYWAPKLAGNRARDRRNDRALRKTGWHVITVWECQLASKAQLERQVARITRLLM
jgi:DNA mismatch endonuclease (patch repair protein)